MKKIIYIFAITLFAQTDLFACNTCGCGVTNYHYGILPQFQKNFIGIRYRYRSYVSELDASHLAPYSYETFQSAEIWGRFYPLKKLQAFVFAPYNFNKRKEGEKVTSLSGLGDIVVSANYNLLNTYDSTNSRVSHNLLVGTGIKLPSGKFREVENGLTVNQNFQLGTGSVDLLLNFIYTLRYKKAGINTEFTYNFNTTNRDEYRFGNTTRTGLSAFFVRKTGAVTIMPNAGLSLETFQDNKQYEQSFKDSGGYALLYNAGIEAYYKNLAVGFTYANPGKQALFNGYVTAGDRIAMHLTYMF